MQKPEPAYERPAITEVAPRAAISGGEISVQGRGFAPNGRVRPLVRFGDLLGSLLMASPSRLVVRVPDGVVNGNLTVDTGSAVSAPVPVSVGAVVAENLHPVSNPALDAAGNIFTTLSGSRGQKTPVSVYKIENDHTVRPFLSDVMNPTGLAFDRAGLLYVSSRMDGAIYQIKPDGHRTVYAEGMGIATGIAFDKQGNLYVGDRSGTIFRINTDRQIFVFATLEPSIAAYHLAFGLDNCLYVTGPTTSSFDHIYRVSPSGEVSSFYRGLGRPQGLTFDVKGNLYVAASLSGRRGVVRIDPDGKADLVISGPGIVGLALTPKRSAILASAGSLYEISVDIEGLHLPLSS
ncbi:MAG: gluconolaconase [Terriglobia bacterium]